ncbi:unnamed protein product [Amoebophrya sp. A120]|nr:unnamed protein product [Amoebophrya sp. A120]|eukprot:GSA120T00018868001.1
MPRRPPLLPGLMIRQCKLSHCSCSKWSRSCGRCAQSRRQIKALRRSGSWRNGTRRRAALFTFATRARLTKSFCSVCSPLPSHGFARGVLLPSFCWSLGSLPW